MTLTLRNLGLLGAAALVALACGGRSVEGDTPAKALDISYVSGHLGNDQGCSATRDAGDAAGAFAPCEAGDDTCRNAYPSCEDGAVTIQITNDGDEALSKLDVGALLLHAVGGSASDLAILGVTRDDGSTFDGTLQPAQSIKIRVKFPAVGLSAAPKGATLEITVVTEGGGEKRIETPELQVVPTWAT